MAVGGVAVNDPTAPNPEGRGGEEERGEGNTGERGTWGRGEHNLCYSL